MTIPASFLEELRGRTPINSVISRTVRLARSGRNWKGCCPFHGEKSPSFYVYADHFHCFGCGAHGDVIGFVMQSRGGTFPEAVEALASEAGMQVPKATPEAAAAERQRLDLNAVLEAAAAAFQRRLHLPEGAAGLAYLRDRGLSDDTIQRFGLGWSGAGRGAIASDLGRQGVTTDQLIEAGLIRRDDETARVTDLFFNRVMFPIRDRRGRVVSFGGRVLGDGLPKYVNGPETVLFSKRRTLYGLDLAREGLRTAGDLIVVEGYMDVIALHQAGFTGAVAPLGTALTEEQMAELWRLSPAPVLCFDGDRAGTRAAARTADLALPLVGVERGLRFATVPAGDDPDTLIRRDGADAFRAVLVQSRPFSIAAYDLMRQPAGEPTPELRAAFRARLMDAAGRIQDSALAGECRRAWIDRFTRNGDGVPAPDQVTVPTQVQGCIAACQARFPVASGRALDLVAGIVTEIGRDDLVHLVAAAPVTEQDGVFAVLWDGKPRASQWRILLAVRDGIANPDHAGSALDDTARRSVLIGDCLDVIACHPGLLKVMSRMMGATSVLGWPQHPEMIIGPARVHETPWAWLRDDCRGAVPIGDQYQVRDWLLRCANGVTAAARPMALNLDKQLRNAGQRRPQVYIREAA